VPFCLGKCAYCGFYSTPWRNALANRYLDALTVEASRRLAGERPAAGTIYFGGGTPTVLSNTQLSRLLSIVTGAVSLTETTEWTVEANPGTLAAASLRALRRAGVNRVSLGVQSLDDATLRRIGRPHSGCDVIASVRLLRRAGFDNIGIDLIAALPGVPAAQWDHTLDGVLALQPQHVSVYALSIEPGSRLARDIRAGRLNAPTDDEQVEAVERAAARLSAAGFRRYEVSNFARPGHECRHNLACWRGDDYLGLGPAAASRVGLRRWQNRPDLERYAQNLLAGRLPPCSRETLDEATDRCERIAFAFRLCSPVNPAVYAGDNAKSAECQSNWGAALEACRRQGLIGRRGATWLTTKRGLNFADEIARRLLATRTLPPSAGRTSTGRDER